MGDLATYAQTYTCATASIALVGRCDHQVQKRSLARDRLFHLRCCWWLASRTPRLCFTFQLKFLRIIRGYLTQLGFLVPAQRNVPEGCCLSSLDAASNSRPMINKEGALSKEIPLAPFSIEKEHKHPGLDERQPLMRHIPHLRVARDDYRASSSSKSLDPRHVVFLEVIIFAWFWRVLRSACYLKRADLSFQLPLVGESLEDFDHRNRNVLVKRYFQAALRNSCSNFTASRTCRSGTSNMSATNAALPSTWTDCANVAVGIRLAFNIGRPNEKWG